MVTGHVFIATSIDGFIARKDGDLDWLMAYDTGDEDHGYDAFMESVDGLIMGSGTFEKVLTFGEWPYQGPVIVMSSRLTEKDVPENLKNKVRISNETPDALMETLDKEGWSKAYVDGGKIIQSFLRAGLISDIVLTRVPVLIGDGLTLFGALDADIKLDHIETESFPSGLIGSKYKVLNEN
ncbi:MAG: dihydrofolate reductase family protein [Parasphingorhabdus sp.]|uniref:dihydrofolate reductase family protein n=1 Tax=Parasphingorhabdus sp. TaxID=2709688 RepID=UPI0032978AA9